MLKANTKFENVFNNVLLCMLTQMSVNNKRMSFVNYTIPKWVKKNERKQVLKQCYPTLKPPGPPSIPGIR